MLAALLAAKTFLSTNLRSIAIVIAVGTACFFLGRCEGVRVERAAWEAQANRIKLAAEKLQRTADQFRAAREAADTARIASNRQEVDNAVRDIPDQSTSARQRARACLELVRQGASPANLDAAGCAAPPR